jgi:hypothetical protein
MASLNIRPLGWEFIHTSIKAVKNKVGEKQACDTCRLRFDALISMHRHGYDWSDDGYMCGPCLQQWIAAKL